MTDHERLCAIKNDLPADYGPWGKAPREGSDCSCGCVHAKWLEGLPDWCVCVNPASHRCGLLTFEHQAGGDCFEDESP